MEGGKIENYTTLEDRVVSSRLRRTALLEAGESSADVGVWENLLLSFIR